MAFPVPTLSTVLTRIRNDFKTEAGTNQAFIRRSPEYILSRVLGFIAKGLYGYIADRYRQAFYDTADDTNFWKWAGIFGMTQTPAVAWKGTVTFTGTPSTSIPAGTAIQRADGVQYTTDAIDSIGGGGSVTIACTASTTGATTSNEDGTILSLTSPISGVDSDATVADTTTSGADAESRDAGQIRLQEQLANPAGGGAAGQYVTWAKSVSGVTRAWEFANLNGYGTVAVAFVRDNDTPIIPDASERSAVQTVLDNNAPITADVDVTTVTSVSLNVTISNLVPDTTTVRTAIEDSIKDMLIRDFTPGSPITVTQVEDAISGAAGEVSHTLVSPTADTTTDKDEILEFGTLTVT